MGKEFNFEKAVQDLLSGKKLTGKDGVLTPLIKELVETALEAEITSHLSSRDNSDKPNRRNGYNKKTIKSSSGSFELETPSIVQLIRYQEYVIAL